MYCLFATRSPSKGPRTIGGAPNSRRRWGWRANGDWANATDTPTGLVENPRPRSTMALVEALATTRLDERPAERDAGDASRAGARLLTTSTPATYVIDTPLAEAFAARRANLRELRAAMRALSDDTPSDARSRIESGRSSISTSAIIVRDFSGEARGGRCSDKRSVSGSGSATTPPSHKPAYPMSDVCLLLPNIYFLTSYHSFCFLLQTVFMQIPRNYISFSLSSKSKNHVRLRVFLYTLKIVVFKCFLHAIAI